MNQQQATCLYYATLCDIARRYPDSDVRLSSAGLDVDGKLYLDEEKAGRPTVQTVRDLHIGFSVGAVSKIEMRRDCELPHDIDGALFIRIELWSELD